MLQLTSDYETHFTNLLQLWKYGEYFERSTLFLSAAIYVDSPSDLIVN